MPSPPDGARRRRSWGLCTPLEWMRGKTVVVKRPPIFFSKRFPSQIELHFGMPPQSYSAYGGDAARYVADTERIVRDVENALAAERKRPVVGAEQLRARHPHDEPDTLPDRWSERRPTLYIGCREPEQRRERFRDATAGLQHFRRLHEEARQAELAGEKAVYPHGTDFARRVRGQEVAPPSDDLMSRPGEFDASWFRNVGVDREELSSELLVHEERCAVDTEQRQTDRQNIASAVLERVIDATSESTDSTSEASDEEPDAPANLQPTAKQRPSQQPPPIRRDRYDGPVSKLAGSRVIVRRDLLPPHRRPPGTDLDDDH